MDLTRFSSYDMLPGGVLITRADSERGILYGNNAVARMFDCNNIDEFYSYYGNSYKNMIDEADFGITMSEIWMQVYSEGNKFNSIQYKGITKNGQIKSITECGHIIHDDELGDVFCSFLTDYISEIQVSDYDSLTSLPGMKRFFEYSEYLVKSYRLNPNSKPLNLVFFNLQNFKKINFEYGIEMGDKCLKDTAQAIKSEFSKCFLSRFSGDNFVLLSDSTHVEEKIQRVHNNLSGLRNGVSLNLKAGICTVTDQHFEITELCDLAKVACRTIKNDGVRCSCFYDDSMKSLDEISKYVVSNLEEAIEKDYIQVFYQPVVRTLTGKICGAEALARWIDPKYGLLSPFRFIGPLEEANKIHLLDAHIIRSVCRAIRNRIDEGKAIVPVSVNLSRQDFINCDIYEVVENSVREFVIPREYINIEITESFMAEEGLVKNEMNRFKARGYNVWMDDFGSGYSALNVLKEADFDELKIDMVFLSDFSDKSKEIIKAIVEMAKKINMHTLAEGVESQEQYDFLKSIGCEKLQGYFFGKPVSSDEMCRKLDEEAVEAISDQKYFENVGRINLVSSKPLALIELVDDKFSVYFMNNAYLNALKSNGTASVQIAEYNMNDATTPEHKIYLGFANKALESSDPIVFTYNIRGRFMRLSLEVAAKCDTAVMFKASLEEIKLGSDLEKQKKIDEYVRGISFQYDYICMVDLKNDELKLIMQDGDYSRYGEKTHGLKSYFEFISEKKVFSEDKAEFLRFVNVSSLSERVSEVENGILNGRFRILSGNSGNYIMKLFTFMKIPNSSSYMLTIKNSIFPNKTKDYSEGSSFLSIGEIPVNYNVLFDTILDNTSSRKFFIKDTAGRYVRISSSLFNYFNLDDMNDVIGKNDSEIGWTVNSASFAATDSVVINEGKTLVDLPGKCIIDGQIHNILSSKTPIYKDGWVVGILGYFIDIDREEARYSKGKELITEDTVSGMMNEYGTFQAILQYWNEHMLKKEEFTLSYIRVLEYDHIVNTYGAYVGDSLILRIADIISRNNQFGSAVGRILGCSFVLINKSIEPDRLNNILEQIKRQIEEITEIDGNSISLYPTITVSKSSDFNTAELFVEKAMLKV